MLDSGTGRVVARTSDGIEATSNPLLVSEEGPRVWIVRGRVGLGRLQEEIGIDLRDPNVDTLSGVLAQGLPSRSAKRQTMSSSSSANGLR